MVALGAIDDQGWIPLISGHADRTGLNRLLVTTTHHRVQSCDILGTMHGWTRWAASTGSGQQKGSDQNFILEFIIFTLCYFRWLGMLWEHWRCSVKAMEKVGKFMRHVACYIFDAY